MDKPAYQVLARKWRPQHFDAVVGQKHVVQTPANALDQGRIAHAYCFSGIRGVGKTTIARLLAKGLNCRAVQQPTSKPCGQCESCLEIEQSRSLDVVELDAASQSGVENIRELTEVTRYAPSRDRYRVFITDEAHMLSPAAFNALLKTLEEPPAHVVFVLATTEATKILPTVLSRCQHYQFGRISQRDISAHLARMARAENITISDDGLALIATAADGSLRDAQSLLDKLILQARLADEDDDPTPDDPGQDDPEEPDDPPHDPEHPRPGDPDDPDEDEEPDDPEEPEKPKPDKEKCKRLHEALKEAEADLRGAESLHDGAQKAVNEKTDEVDRKQAAYEEALIAFAIENGIVLIFKTRLPPGVQLPSDVLRAKEAYEIASRELEVLIEELHRAEDKLGQARERVAELNEEIEAAGCNT